MGMTIVEKILASHSDQDQVRPGDLVVVDVDKAIQLDPSFIAKTEPLPVKIAKPENVFVILDHKIPAPTIRDADAHQIGRQWAAEYGIRLYDVGRGGIVHQVVLEEGLAVPGEILTCADSHTCSSGAVNCAARGMGRPEMLQIVCTGRTWFKVSPTIRYQFVGKKPPGVFGKDVLFKIAAEHGEHTNTNLEFGGLALGELTMDDRATICTLAAELSADFATFEHDEFTAAFLSESGVGDYTPVAPDGDASYSDVREISLSALEPYVTLPDYVPNNSYPVSEVDPVPIDQAFIGSCANGKLEDLRIASEVLEGREVAEGVRLIVTPASTRVYLEASRRGYLAKIVEAGGVVTNSTCGACPGNHMGVLGTGEVCITSSTRNFKGRMGSPEAQIYMGSSATVAASAVAGCITDPREFLA